MQSPQPNSPFRGSSITRAYPCWSGVFGVNSYLESLTRGPVERIMALEDLW